ncbi:hypothetical protein ISCGN_029442 [Ixodes scapularis]
MACSTVPEDITGTLRGRWSECECGGFRRLVELVNHERVPVSWCILCGHSPISHGDCGQTENAPTPTFCEQEDESVVHAERMDTTETVNSAEEGHLHINQLVQQQEHIARLQNSQTLMDSAVTITNSVFQVFRSTWRHYCLPESATLYTVPHERPTEK